MQNKKILRLTITSILIAIDTFCTVLITFPGMAPMSSVINVILGVLVGPLYAFIVATMTGILRMILFGSTPLAVVGAFIGATLAATLYRFTNKVWMSWVGEIIGTGIIASLISYPVMVWFTGSSNGLYWLIYTPTFMLATLVGGFPGMLISKLLLKQRTFINVQKLFKKKK
ncbi:energy coupling factor transporter S component ThiW [Companilactobacillus sp. RD055328]|uniref:energy coupling factor transporter S component ThiW n=1 Tax=Companilactobacillus sp. RD055328 TaxID=2916634 RepID=UPI001FC8897A|nr:energy coupling factor transporter S component ThiW [Companilactobacillus sp. RD055328]GKQ42236.1 energy coupling factor transporter S component ThiW [Companilactobacillus sp. RD055328]